MPLLRVEVTAESRESARRVLDAYRNGKRDRDLELRVVDEVGRLGRTARGRPRLTGTTNGNPPLLLFDVEVESETST